MVSVLLILPPTPCARRPNSFALERCHMWRSSLSGRLMSCLYSSCFPVFGSVTALASRMSGNGSSNMPSCFVGNLGRKSFYNGYDAWYVMVLDVSQVVRVYVLFVLGVVKGSGVGLTDVWAEWGAYGCIR